MTVHTTVFLLDSFREGVLFYGDIQTAVNKLRDQYGRRIDVTLEGEFKDDEAVCEELFDLTNNPYRQEEREDEFGRNRSISVGDIIGVYAESDVITKFYVCAPSGWVSVK